VFSVGGVIDLDGRPLAIRIPDVTIAGESAPCPGITLVRGGLSIATHDVIVRHVRVRVGEAGHGKRSGWNADGVSTDGAHDVIVDNVIHNPGGVAISYGLVPEEWQGHQWQRGALTVVGNVVRQGPSSGAHLGFALFVGPGPCDAFFADNLFFDQTARGLPTVP